MRIGHLSDSHLGVRKGHRTGPGGLNQRELDVANAFRRAIDGMIAARPDLVLHTGDVFESKSPTNAATLFAYQQFRRLRDALPEAPIVVIAGNHDTPKSAGIGSPLRLLGELGVHIATREARDFAFPALDLIVRGVPSAALGSKAYVLEPPCQARYEVLCLHGEVEGLFPVEWSRLGEETVTAADLEGGWSYVALGDYHVQHEVGPRIWYAGALDYTSSNLWGELADEAKHGVKGKGWLLADLDTGDVARQPIALARPIHDLPGFSAIGLTPEEVSARMAEVIAAVPGGIAGAMVRLVVSDVPREIARQLDHGMIRKWKDAALFFRLDLRKPDTQTGNTAISRHARSRMPLSEIVGLYLAQREIPPGMDATEFVKLGASLMDGDDYCGMPREGAA